MSQVTFHQTTQNLHFIALANKPGTTECEFEIKYVYARESFFVV